MSLFSGTDPGLSGAICFYYPEAHRIEIFDMPVLALTRGGKNRNEIDYYAVGRLFKDRRVTAAFVERVQSMPGQGVSSSFSFGRSTGIILGAIAAHEISIEEVAPQKWQRYLGIPPKAGKDANRALAMKLFPKQAELFARKKDDGRSDAALLAVYGYRISTGVKAEPVVPKTLVPRGRKE